jgi:hypothetical protein
MKGVVIGSLVTIFTVAGVAHVGPAEAGDVRVGVSIGFPVPFPVVVVRPPVVYAPPRVVYAPPPRVHYSYPHRYSYPNKRGARWSGAREFRGRHGHIPPGHLPPPGECRVWLPGRPPGHQPPPGRC